MSTPPSVFHAIRRGVTLCFLGLWLYPCHAGLLDDFEDNAISTNWVSGGSTFQLSESDGVLVVDYARTEQSGQWDQFHLNCEAVAIEGSYNLMLRVSSELDTRLSVKPVYADGTDDWLQRNVSGDAGWVDVVFHIELEEGKQLDTIFFYLDGGSVEEKTGVFRMDDLQIKVGEDITGLTVLLDHAQNRLNTLETGDADGMFEEAVVVFFEEAVSESLELMESGEFSAETIAHIHNRLMEAFYVTERRQKREPELYGPGKNNIVHNRRTRLLFENLRRIAQYRTLFGMQDPTGYGVGWTGDMERSDVESVCGAYPALAGWGISELADGGDGVDLAAKMTFFHEMGAVNSLEWHMDNPLGGDFYWSNREVDDNAVASILPEGERHEQFLLQLDRIADFLKSLRDRNGESVPVIFRPFHECNGDWFWWGKGHCTPQQYKQLFRFTVNYLRSQRVTNMLVAYSTDRFNSREEYLLRYPGDAVIDVIAADNYWDLRYHEGSLNIPGFVSQMRTLVELAEEREKVAALSECGYEGIPYEKWFTEVLLEPIKQDPTASRLAYFAVWRNANTSHHYAPYPGHSSVEDFLRFYEDPSTLFVDDQLPDLFGDLLSESRILNPGKPDDPDEKQEPSIRFVSMTAVDNHVSLELGKTAARIVVVSESGEIVLELTGEREAAGFSLSEEPDGWYAIGVDFSDGSRESVLYRKATPVPESD